MKRVALARMGLVALGLLVGLGGLAVLEGVLRLAGTGSRVSPEDVGRPAWIDDEGWALFRAWAGAVGVSPKAFGDLAGWRFDPRLRWSLRPDVDLVVPNIFLDPEIGEDATWQMTTNSRGYRTPDFEDVKEPGTTRVVVVGDSNSMGWLLDDEDTYAQKLASRLSERLGRPVEVVNLAVSGYTTTSCRIVMSEVGFALDPDAIVVSCGANDPQPMATSDDEFAAAGSGMIGRLEGGLGRLRLVTVLQQLRPKRPAAQVERVDARGFEANLMAIFGEASQRGIPATYLRLCCCAPPRSGSLARVLARTGAGLVGANEAHAAFTAGVATPYAEAHRRILSWYSSEELAANPWLTFLYRDRCHENPLGTSLVADALAESIAPRLQARRASR